MADGRPASARSGPGTGNRDEPHVTLAAVAGAHGVAGEVRLKLFAQGLESLQRHKQVHIAGRPFTLKAVRGGKLPVARFAEVADRDAAEALRGQLVTVPRSTLPPLEEGEYYFTDLIGLACTDPSGEPLGTVVGVENFGAGDLLEVELPGGRRALVPFKPGMADLEGDRVRVDPAFLA